MESIRKILQSPSVCLLLLIAVISLEDNHGTTLFTEGSVYAEKELSRSL